MKASRTVFGALGAALTIATLAVVPALAWSDRLQGRPDNLHAGGDVGYYVWHNDDGLHIRTTGPGERHVFHGEVVTPGTIHNVELIRGEGDDAFALRDAGHKLVFTLETWDGIDGLDFNIDGGRGMTLRLERDGGLVSTSEIYLGNDGQHPEHNPFLELR